jgi:CRISPR-associated exonuclease Cas4
MTRHADYKGEEDYLPLSALQHFAYCKRQFALIHMDIEWEENVLTAEGQQLHQRVNSGESESRGDHYVARSLRLISHSLRLIGVSDIVEFRRTINNVGCRLPGRSGRWQPFPIEYKRGRSKTDDWDRLQLCAQAIALEEMLSTRVPEGAIFYGKSRRRESVQFTDSLRQETELLAQEMHSVFASGVRPPPETGTKCEACSLKDICLPECGSVQHYMEEIFRE